MGKIKRTRKHKLGDRVFILARRSEGGSSHVAPSHPMADEHEVFECIVDQVDICGVKGCYGLRWADNDKPVGIPFYDFSFCTSDGKALL